MSAIKKTMKLLIRICSILYLAVLCILWASSYWPRQVWWLADLFQMAPLWILYFPIGFLFVIGVLVKEKKIILVQILCFVIVFFGIMGFNIPSSAHMRTPGHLRIMTCNLGTNFDVTALHDFISKTQPDVIALQEVYANNQNALEAILSRDKWYLSFQEYLGLASRLKIRNVEMKNRRIMGGWGGLAAKYELEGKMGPIHFFNLHLETPRDGLEAVIDRGLGGVSKFKKVTELQDKESEVVSQWIKSYKTVLVAGDFNISTASPIYKKYWTQFTDTFLKRGFGFGYTYHTGWHGVRIDHVLCDSDWRVIRFQTGPDIGTEHRPVIADVEFIGISPKQTQPEEPKEQADTALKIERNAGSNEASASIQLDFWNLEIYPIASFIYMIPEGIGLDMRVKTIYNDWVDLKETHLIADGKWHEAYIDVRAIVKSILPAVKYLTGFQFYIPGDGHQRDIYWIDDFKIRRDLNEK